MEIWAADWIFSTKIGTMTSKDVVTLKIPEDHCIRHTHQVTRAIRQFGKKQLATFEKQKNGDYKVKIKFNKFLGIVNDTSE